MLIVGDTNFVRIGIQDLFDNIMDNGKTFCYNITAEDGFKKVVVQGVLQLPTTETDPLIPLYIIITLVLVVFVVAAVCAVLGIVAIRKKK
jgi:hypothetical protein